MDAPSLIGISSVRGYSHEVLQLIKYCEIPLVAKEVTNSRPHTSGLLLLASNVNSLQNGKSQLIAGSFSLICGVQIWGNILAVLGVG